MHSVREYIDGGGLMSYGPNYQDLFRRAGDMVDKIFRGAKAGEIPIEQPNKIRSSDQPGHREGAARYDSAVALRARRYHHRVRPHDVRNWHCVAKLFVALRECNNRIRLNASLNQC